MPTGCQTVLVSRNAVIRSRPGSDVQSGSTSGARSTRLRFSAAEISRLRAVSASPASPVRSRALTSMCDASVGAVSPSAPVSTLTTPPGTSEVASTSDSVIAGSGRSAEVATTTVLPVTITGATTLTSPSREEPCGATTPTTPVGSGSEKLKYGAATGLVPPTTWAILSAHPAYQTSRSTDASTTVS